MDEGGPATWAFGQATGCVELEGGAREDDAEGRVGTCEVERREGPELAGEGVAEEEIGGGCGGGAAEEEAADGGEGAEGVVEGEHVPAVEGGVVGVAEGGSGDG